MRKLSSQIDENIETAKEILPIGTSFDMITRDLFLGGNKRLLDRNQRILQDGNTPADFFGSSEPFIYEGFLYRRYQALHECQNRLCPGFLDGGLG